MKIIHTSDLHIDSPLTSRLSPERVRERRAELFATFTAMVERATVIGARSIIIAGDLFDSERISKSSRRRALGLIEGHPEISFFYLPGNHELLTLLDGGAELPRNLFVFGEDWTYFSAGDTVIAGRRTTSRDMFETLSLPSDTKNIVVLHGELRDRSDEGGVIGRRDAAGKSIDYLALGHYHSYSAESIDPRCTAVYSGTPEGRGFDEVGDKGFSLIETDGTGVRHRFVSFARRLLHELRVDVSGAVDTYAVERATETALSGVKPTDLVRIILTGYHPVGTRPDVAALVTRFSSRYYYFEAKDETRLKISAADYEHDRSLKGEFIRLVMADHDLSAERKDEIINCGLSALLGEEAI